MGNISETIELVEAITCFGCQLRAAQIAVTLLINCLTDGIVGIVDALVLHPITRLLHTGKAIERIVGIGIGATSYTICGISGREDIAYGVVVVGH